MSTEPAKKDETIIQYADGDGDDGNGNNLERDFIERISPPCTWSDDPDEHRRVFILKLMADPDINGVILVENMDAVAKWLKDGTVPTRAKR